MNPTQIGIEYVHQVELHRSVFDPLHCEACNRTDANFCAYITNQA